MPQYDFYIDGSAIDDEPIRHRLATIAAAKCEAAKNVGAIICDREVELSGSQEWGIRVADETGLTLFTVTISVYEAPAILGAEPSEAAKHHQEPVDAGAPSLQ